MAKNNYSYFSDQVENNGDALAFITDKKTYTFKEFLNLVDSVAGGLDSQGVAKGDRVCTLAENLIEHIALLVACFKIGAIAYPINWRLSPDEIQLVINLADPKILVVEDEYFPQLANVEMPESLEGFMFGDTSKMGFKSFDSLISDKETQMLEVNDDDPAVVISTAAVDGKPRGAVLTHKNLEASVEVIDKSFQITGEDRNLAVLPLFHITGLQLVLGVSATGGVNAIMSRFDPVVGSEWIEDHKITFMVTFPPMLEMLLGAREMIDSDWKSLKFCFGILNTPDVIQKYLETETGEYWTGYGQSETTGAVTMINVADRPGSIGKPVDGVELRLVDEMNKDVPVGEVGEIAVRGNIVFAGYWREPDASAFASRYGWHHTGDLGKMDAEGYIYYEGRKLEKDLIKSGGENIYPAEVEFAIRSLPDVNEVCVISVPDEKWGETVKAIIEMKSIGPQDSESIMEGLVGKLASYKKPHHIEFVDLLPRMKNGLIDREAAKASYGNVEE